MTLAEQKEEAIKLQFNLRYLRISNLTTVHQDKNYVDIYKNGDLEQLQFWLEYCERLVNRKTSKSI